jgi:iron complex transport system substrate-binding protein
LWVGEATCRGYEAEDLLTKIGTRLGELERQLEGIEHRPRVAILEWLEPFYVSGHWVPEMIEVAGGKDVLGRKRTPSFRVTAEDVIDAAPEILLIAQCGYGAKQARDEYLGMSFPEEWSAIPAVRNSRVYAMDASGYFSRPGPRLITGIEALAKILHPEVTVSPEAESVAMPISVSPITARTPSVRAASAY